MLNQQIEELAKRISRQFGQDGSFAGCPSTGSELLLSMAKEAKPLIIVDPFRYFHGAEENDSTEMSGVMQYLRACAAFGCAVVILHHPAKSEGSTGRGSSVIRSACDLALLHSLDKESGLITLKVDKNRFGESRTITIRADFEEGQFNITDAPYITRRNDELAKLEQIIKDNPGISQNGVCKQLSGRRNRIARLLKEGNGTRWRTEQGKHGSILYQPLAKPLFPKTGIGDTGNENPNRDNLYRCSPPFLPGIEASYDAAEPVAKQMIAISSAGRGWFGNQCSR